MTDAMLDTPPATPSPPASLTESARAAAESGGEQIIAERYRLVRQLGEGAMGAVFLAEHVHMRKRFALKLLLPEAMASPEIVARFEREAIAAGNIGHPGVCAATDFGRLEDGAFFLVLEYVDGRSLRHVVHEGAMPPDRALSIARQVLAALGAAHAKGVVHRDIKPENVMLTRGATEAEDVVKVLDFGIAKVDANSLGEGQGTNLTRMGAIYGTPAYMAPEQAMGRAIDHRVDLYAVGVMLHEMIAGAPPFDGEGVVILAKHVHEPPPRLTSPLGAEVSQELAAFVARLLAKDPDARPADAQTAIAELDQARATLASFDRMSMFGGATAATFAGATAPTFAGSASPLAAAPTVAGTPTPPPTSLTSGAPRAQSPLDVVLAALEPAAKRLGVNARMLLVAAGAAFGVFLVLVITIAVVATRPTADGREADAEAERPRRKPAAASSVEPTSDVAASAAPEKPTASPSPVASASAKPAKAGKSQGGGNNPVKSLGKKIKGLF